MEKRIKPAKAEIKIVNKELDQGLRARERRQPRGSGIVSTSWPGSSSACFFVAPGLPVISAGGFDPLPDSCVRLIVFSTFLLSRVSECLVTSYLAEVKLLFFPWLPPAR